jgi:hypothetical protein
MPEGAISPGCLSRKKSVLNVAEILASENRKYISIFLFVEMGFCIIGYHDDL